MSHSDAPWFGDIGMSPPGQTQETWSAVNSRPSEIGTTQPWVGLWVPASALAVGSRITAAAEYNVAGGVGGTLSLRIGGNRDGQEVGSQTLIGQTIAASTNGIMFWTANVVSFAGSGVTITSAFSRWGADISTGRTTDTVILRPINWLYIINDDALGASNNAWIEVQAPSSALYVTGKN